MAKTLAQARAEQARADKDAQLPNGHRPTGRQSTYDLLLLKLSEDKRALKAIESIERKIELKRLLLPHYQDWVDAVLAHGNGSPDNVLMTVMLWRIDVGAFSGALAIAKYAIQHGLNMPDSYQRKTPTVVAEEIADTAKSMLAHPVGVDMAILLEQLKEAEALTCECDMADEVRAKLHRVLGMASQEIEPEFSLKNFREAYRLNEKIGVKTNINQLEKQLAKPAS